MELPQITGQLKVMKTLPNFNVFPGIIWSNPPAALGSWSLDNFRFDYLLHPLQHEKRLLIASMSTDLSGVKNIILYSYKELQAATNDFSRANKIGEGGFGSVYKGTLKNGSVAAIKVLSAHSSQGLREFLTEIKVISEVEHDNLVKLYGCCAEGSHRILVYGYLENNSLAQTLLGGCHSSIQFSWQTRRKICIGVAQGLAFLHEDVHPHIIHRDIKASNILLARDLTPKISDFGLAKFIQHDLTHISTRVAGTAGYLAPEYAIRGQVTRKADIYSFGVLILEIVSGRCNTNRRLPAEEQYLLLRGQITNLDIKYPNSKDPLVFEMSKLPLHRKGEYHCACVFSKTSPFVGRSDVGEVKEKKIITFPLENLEF
ncbi:hypothetical protein CJ030_MR4G023087 [Morella rubra]|uniref:non-specific serine/threonine protein kinase n=1 Tax=Morella rubra TaxID=262757 RepID=A0A6A1W122_9ROSI|nr:hypothetical protein CJ030_MR4G023087 [Morella rubra]